MTVAKPIAASATATITDVASADAASITVDTISRRMLRLISSLHDARDLTPKHIELQTGFNVEFHPTDPGIYGFGGKLADMWAYSLVSTPDKIGAKPTGLRLRFDRVFFDDGGVDGKTDPAPVGGIDFEGFRFALNAAGFDARPVRGYRGIDCWYLRRGDIGVIVYTHDNVDPDAGRACVAKILIRAYA